MQYKNAAVRGTVHRLFQIAWSRKNFDSDLNQVKRVFETNQYPPAAYNPLIRDSLNRILDRNLKDKVENEKSGPLNTLFLQYRGTVSDWFKNKIRSIDGVGRLSVIFTTKNCARSCPLLSVRFQQTSNRMWFTESLVLGVLPSMLDKHSDICKRDATSTQKNRILLEDTLRNAPVLSNQYWKIQRYWTRRSL